MADISQYYEEHAGLVYKYLPIGFDAREDNATRQAFDEQYSFV